MAEINIGSADVKPDARAHTRGINQGNSRGNYEKNSGHHPDGQRSARASTGVNPEAHDPIDPSMPNLSPG
jgi:hypothetical protein